MAEKEAHETQSAVAQSLLELKQQRLPAEPEPKMPGVVELQIRLPDGSALRRRFMCTDHVQSVLDVIDVHTKRNHSALDGYTLESTYPRRELVDVMATLEACGIAHGRFCLVVADKECDSP